MQKKTKQPLPPLWLTRILLSTVLAILCLSGGTAVAASSREEAASEAMMQHGQAGKVLSIREKNSDQGSTWYEVKILTDGNVSVYRIQKD